MGGDRGMEGGGAPDLLLENYKLSFISKNYKLSFIPPPPPLLELSGSAHACLTVEFYFLSSLFFACNRFSYYTFWRGCAG